MDFMKKKKRSGVKSVFSKLVTRPGAEKLLAWLEEETDFFTAPRLHKAPPEPPRWADGA